MNLVRHIEIPIEADFLDASVQYRSYFINLETKKQTAIVSSFLDNGLVRFFFPKDALHDFEHGEKLTFVIFEKNHTEASYKYKGFKVIDIGIPEPQGEDNPGTDEEPEIYEEVMANISLLEIDGVINGDEATPEISSKAISNVQIDSILSNVVILDWGDENEIEQEYIDALFPVNSGGGEDDENVDTPENIPVSVYIQPNERCSVEVIGDLFVGETITIKCTPVEGWNVEYIIINDNYIYSDEYSFTLEGDVVGAVAVQRTIYRHTVTIQNVPNADANGAGTYNRGESVTLLCTPHEGYLFDYWIINGERINYQTYTFLIYNDITAVPIMKEKPASEEETTYEVTEMTYGTERADIDSILSGTQVLSQEDTSSTIPTSTIINIVNGTDTDTTFENDGEITRSDINSLFNGIVIYEEEGVAMSNSDIDDAMTDGYTAPIEMSSIAISNSVINDTLSGKENSSFGADSELTEQDIESAFVSSN